MNRLRSYLTRPIHARTRPAARRAPVGHAPAERPAHGHQSLPTISLSIR